MRIVTFNVNGLRSIVEYYQTCKGWDMNEWLESLQADIVCLQETKVNGCDRLDRQLALPLSYTGYFAFQKGRKKIGYSGVATYCRKGWWEPIKYVYGLTQTSPLLANGSQRPMASSHGCASKIDELQLDEEGRCIISDHGQFILFNVYFPNDSGPERDEFRAHFYPALWNSCLDFLEAGRSIILLGDLNVTPHPIDNCDFAPAYQRLLDKFGQDVIRAKFDEYFATITFPPSSSLPVLCMPVDRSDAAHVNSDKENDEVLSLLHSFYGAKPIRGWLYNLLNYDREARKYGLRDAFRHCHPTAQAKYTHWNTLLSARGTNYGTRIDSILLAGPLFQAICSDNPQRVASESSSSVVDCDIWSEYLGSDHCPVWIELDLTAPCFPFPAKSQNIKHHLNQRNFKDFLIPGKPKADPVATTAAVVGVSDTVGCSVDNGGKLKKIKITDYFPVTPTPDESKCIPSTDSTMELSASEHDHNLSQITPTLSSGPPSTLEWKSIFGKGKPVPLCRGHGEACETKTVNKRGPNRGRRFYICSRGVGHANDPSSRCDHFEWYKQT